MVSSFITLVIWNLKAPIYTDITQVISNSRNLKKQTFVLLSILSDWILTATVNIFGQSTPTPSEVVLLRPSSSEKQIVGSNQWGRIVLGSRTSDEGTTPSTIPAERFCHKLSHGSKLLLIVTEHSSYF